MTNDYVSCVIGYVEQKNLGAVYEPRKASGRIEA